MKFWQILLIVIGILGIIGFLVYFLTRRKKDIIDREKLVKIEQDRLKEIKRLEEENEVKLKKIDTELKSKLEKSKGFHIKSGYTSQEL